MFKACVRAENAIMQGAHQDEIDDALTLVRSTAIRAGHDPDMVVEACLFVREQAANIEQMAAELDAPTIG